MAEEIEETTQHEVYEAPWMDYNDRIVTLNKIENDLWFLMRARYDRDAELSDFSDPLALIERCQAIREGLNRHP